MNGALIIDKAAGMTSHDVVARVRKIVGERRVGHTGTLDPFATGVLVVLIGRATRLMQFLAASEKEYAAGIRFGYATDTGDLTGMRMPPEAATQTIEHVSRKEIETAMALLRGEIEQTPPMYSAKKIEGRKLYELARQGKEVERKPVRVLISEFSLLDQSESFRIGSEDGTTDIAVRVVCSAGTYVRTLAEDLGKQLGTGAHLIELRRTRAGAFRIEDAITLERLEELAANDAAESKLISPDDALQNFPAVELTPEEVRRTINGLDFQTVQDDRLQNQSIRMRTPDGQLIAVGLYDESRNVIHPNVVIADVTAATSS